MGALPILALVAAGGLLLIALGNNAARDGAGSAQPLFWAGLVLIYGPIAFRLLSTSASRIERICLVVLMGVALFLVKVLYSPLEYPPFDELATWRQTHDLLTTGHMFSTNPIAAGYAGFPGLETVTAALAELAGLSIFHAGVIVIGLARAMLMVALFLLLERISRSARAAGIGVAVYACNPSFLYFDSQFAHESLALLLGASLLLVVVDWVEPRRLDARVGAGFLGTMVLLAGALTITHHMTSYALSAFLICWAALAATEGRRGRGINGEAKRLAATPMAGRIPSLSSQLLARGPAFPAILVSGMAAAWFIFVAGGQTVAELGSVFSGAADSVVNLIFGGSGPKTLFQGSSQSNSAAARVLAFGSVIPLLALIPLGFRRTWRASESNSLWRTLALVAALYPITLALRLTLSGTETSQRASEFVYVGLAFFAALLVGGLRLPRRPAPHIAAMAALASLATLMFCGAFIVSELPTTRQPGSYLVGADSRSLTPEGLAAARFAAKYLPPESRVLVDRANGTLLASYGGLDQVLGQIHGIRVARVLFSERFDLVDQKVIRNDAIEYVVVDQRLHRELPSLGFYLEPNEPEAFTRTKPVSRAALDKFRLAAGLNRIYTNGPIAIYSTTRLRSREYAPTARP
ncbi:MAG TPA: hypothetical protein VHU24_02635 [Solirubrobacterales bacterium]|nr:hypothetical protein [Solirubrobacterales bacterium]